MNAEQIAKLRELAHAATPQEIDLCQQKHMGGYIECPHCGGEGSVELKADYCNYDGAAIGVQFYGIGNEHVDAEEYFRVVKPSNILALLDMIDRPAASGDVRATPDMGEELPNAEEYFREQLSETGLKKYMAGEQISMNADAWCEIMTDYGRACMALRQHGAELVKEYAPRAIPNVAPEPFILGNQYRTQDGRLVRFVGIANEGSSYESMCDELGHHRYTRRDFGRGTGAAWNDDCVPPLYTYPAITATAPVSQPAASAERPPAEPVAYMFDVQVKRLGQRRQFAAIDYNLDADETLVSKTPLFYTAERAPVVGMMEDSPIFDLLKKAIGVIALYDNSEAKVAAAEARKILAAANGEQK